MIICSALFFNDESISFMVGKFAGWLMVSPSSAELDVYIPEFYGWFQDDNSYIAGPYFSSSLIFYMYEMPITLNANNSISGSSILSPICQAACS